MEMTIDEVLKIVKDGRIVAITIRGNNEDETKFNQENIEALNVIVETICKYQKIVQIMERTVDDGTSMYDTLQEIEEVIEDGNT